MNETILNGLLNLFAIFASSVRIEREQASRAVHSYLSSHFGVRSHKEYIELYNIEPGQVLYMGDDIPDYHVMKLVGLPTCPQDASQEIKVISRYISHKNGGKGAVREVIEQVMKVQGKWTMYFDGKLD